MQQEAQPRVGELESRLKDAQTQRVARQRRVGEPELAGAGFNAVRARAEKELQAWVTAAGQRAPR